MDWLQKSKWRHIVLLELVVTTGAFLLSPVADLGQSSVLIFEDPLLGQFFMAPNLTFHQDSALKILYGSNNCICRAACFSLGPACQAWSFIEGGEKTSECRLINEGPETTIRTHMEEASYFFKQSSVNGKYLWGEDNLLYVELRGRSHFARAKQRCARIPGHRLIIAHSEQTYDFFIQYRSRCCNSNRFWANLVKIDTKIAQWGDGTNATEKPGKLYIEGGLGRKYFSLIPGSHIFDVSDYARRGVLCQANPFGAEW